MESGNKPEKRTCWTDSAVYPQKSGASEWESIFSTVKANVPSLDSDTSSSDYEDGEVFIFQRAEANLIPDLSEELSDVTLEDLKMQEVFEPIRLFKEAWDDTLKKSEVQMKRAVAIPVPSEHISLESCEASPSPSSPEGLPSHEEAESVNSMGFIEETIGKDELCSDRDLQTGLSVSMEESTYMKANTSSGERNKSTENNAPFNWESWLQQHGDSDMIELDNQPLWKNTGHYLNIDRHTEEDQQDPAIKSHLDLNLQYIMQWDLDKIIQNLQKQEDRSSSDEISLPKAKDVSEHLAAKTQDRLMEQLELLCAKQSREMSSCCNGTAKAEKSSAGLFSLRNQPSSNREKKTVNGRKWGYSEEPPTIYIDLRNVIPRESESLSEDDHGQETDCHTMDQRNVTGKSLLLQQLRKARQESSTPCTPTVEITQNEMSQNLDYLKTSSALNRRKRHLKTRGETAKIALKKSGRCEAETDLPATGLESPESHLPKEPEKNHGLPDSIQQIESVYLSLTKVLESLRTEEKPDELIQKENQLKERQRRQRLQAQLEGLKPRHSMSGRQPMAERTPVLFHMEASYSPSINTLPVVESTKSEMLLMTIWLSSCGQVSSCGQHNSRTPDALLSAANVYHVLVTWLLSLVIGFKVKGGSSAPFQVVGLQQAWREDGLALYACVVPQDESSTQTNLKIRGHKAKENLRGTSTFYQQTSMFLSHTWLHSIIWWREDVINCLQNQLFPLLPEIPAVRLCNIISVNPDPKAVEKAFELPCGFYWQTVETDEKYSPFGTDLGDSTDTEMEVAMMLAFQTLLSNPVAFHHMLQLIHGCSLDICGLRLLYPSFSTLLSSTENLPSLYTAQDGKALPPILALALRGHKAYSTFRDIFGPFDPQLASVTDCHSINAIYCKSKTEPLLYMPHTETRIHWELCVWFGGRVPCNGVVQVGIQNPASKYSRLRSESSMDTENEKGYFQDMALSRPPATLTSVIKGDVFLVVSPAVPPCAYGDVISTCTRQGFSLQGIKRIRISPKRANMLTMTNSQIAVFCPSKFSNSVLVKLFEEEPATEPRLHCLILMLRKENASHHAPALLKGLMNELAEQGFLRDVRSSLPHNVELDLTLCFHIMPYTDGLLQGLGGSLNTLPESGNLAEDIFSKRNYASNPETEQVVILTLTGRDTMMSAGDFLRQILHPPIKEQQPDPGEPNARFELLGLKWLPRLSQGQAKEITPFEVGDIPWQRSIDQLASSPALICALRGINAFVCLAEQLKDLTSLVGKLGSSHGKLYSVMSLTPEMAIRQAALFFTDKDFVADPGNRPTLKYIPPPSRGYRIEGGETRRGQTESVFSYMLSGPQLLCTVLLIKPSAWARNLAKILRKLDLEKFHAVGMKHISLTAEQALELISPEVKQDPETLQAHCSYLTSGPLLVLCLQRQNAVKKLLDLLGPEDPKKARSCDQFLWRAQYGISSVQNGFYSSLSYQTAVRDMRSFFPEGLCCAQSPVLEEEEIFNMKSDPLINPEFCHKRKVVKQEIKRQLSFLSSEPTLIQGLSLLSALCQGTCLIFTAPMLLGWEHPPYIELLDQLISKEFIVTGVRLTRLDQAQAHLISELLSFTDSLSAKCSLLMDGPCLVIAAQRDNAVTCFDNLLNSISWQKPVVQDCMQHLLYPKTEKQAEALLCCFFDSLTLDSIYQIMPQAS